MIFIWQGWGILSAFLPVLSVIPFLNTGRFGIAAGLLIGAAINAYLGYRLNNSPVKTYTDNDTGQEVIFRKKHSLFWIPMQYISVLWVAIAVIMMVG